MWRTYVLPELSKKQIDAIAADDPSLFIDDLVAGVVRERFSFRVVIVPDYASALRLEKAAKTGELSAGRPRLNPETGRERPAHKTGESVDLPEVTRAVVGHCP